MMVQQYFSCVLPGRTRLRMPWYCGSRVDFLSAVHIDRARAKQAVPIRCFLRVAATVVTTLVQHCSSCSHRQAAGIVYPFTIEGGQLVMWAACDVFGIVRDEPASMHGLGGG